MSTEKGEEYNIYFWVFLIQPLNVEVSLKLNKLNHSLWTGDLERSHTVGHTFWAG